MSASPHRRRGARGVALGSLRVLLVVAGGSSLAAAPAALAATWPMFHRDPAHSGVTAETSISTSNVAHLGVAWETNTGSVVQSSPVVAYVPKLGRTLVFVGNQAGKVSAYDAVSGARQWVFSAGANVNSTAAVVGNTLYVGSSDHHLYALDAATGHKVCSFDAGGVISSSPVVANPDGTGKVVYFGDNGFTGNDDGGEEWAVNAVDPNAATNCTRRWRFDAFGDPAGSQTLVGSWSPPAFAKDKGGRPLVVFGSSSPEGAVYALDARDGTKVWRFQTRQEFDSDVGAGPTISPPGVNGFADGVVYVGGKDRVMYALNLRTGAEMWSFDAAADSPDATQPVRSTAALVGRQLVFGYGGGVYALDAVTGAVLWKTAGAEVVASPAIVGPSGGRVVIAADRDGNVFALNLATGNRLWNFPTGVNIYASPSVANGRVYASAANGFLYAFAVGGAGAGAPDTTITSPKDGSTVTNTGSVHITGTATDSAGVSRVLVAIKDVNTGRWWSAGTGSWTRDFTQGDATVASPGGASTTWSFDLPVTSSGGRFYAQAEAVDGDGLHDPVVPSVTFDVASLTFPPETAIASPANDAVFHFPTDASGSPIYAPFRIDVQGTANDTGGAHPGVASVRVVVKNIEHAEYYCGSAGCGSTGSGYWQPTYTALTVPVADPGATSTTWSMSFMTYDHPHNYRVSAWAVDRDGYQDLTKATIRICVRDIGNDVCY